MPLPTSHMLIAHRAAANQPVLVAHRAAANP